jgi:hypothetical protein
VASKRLRVGENEAPNSEFLVSGLWIFDAGQLKSFGCLPSVSAIVARKVFASKSGCVRSRGEIRGQVCQEKVAVSGLKSAPSVGEQAMGQRKDDLSRDGGFCQIGFQIHEVFQEVNKFSDLQSASPRSFAGCGDGERRGERRTELDRGELRGS